ncbi:MAG: lipoprotein [Myxococcota bacterium]|nr:lipoprotein [Myxococcota bacterium]
MRKALIAALALAGLSGCSLKATTLPGAPIPFAEADYQILGATNAEECGTYILGLDLAHLFETQGAGAVGGGDIIQALGGYVTPTVGSPEASRALYYALEKVPEATHLVAPRVHTTVDGISLMGKVIIFGERCASVQARGVRIGDGPAALGSGAM